MSDRRSDQRETHEDYEPPQVQDIPAEDGPAVTAAGDSPEIGILLSGSGRAVLPAEQARRQRHEHTPEVRLLAASDRAPREAEGSVWVVSGRPGSGLLARAREAAEGEGVNLAHAQALSVARPDPHARSCGSRTTAQRSPSGRSTTAGCARGCRLPAARLTQVDSWPRRTWCRVTLRQP